MNKKLFVALAALPSLSGCLAAMMGAEGGSLIAQHGAQQVTNDVSDQFALARATPTERFVSAATAAARSQGWHVSETDLSVPSITAQRGAGIGGVAAGMVGRSNVRVLTASLSADHRIVHLQLVGSASSVSSASSDSLQAAMHAYGEALRANLR